MQKLTKDVLVVEDDELSRYVIVEMCNELGYQCLVARNGEQAIDVMVANCSTIGIVLMDIHMPILSGLDATTAIRGHAEDPPKNIPIVATTADVQWHPPERCYSHGFSSVLPKPISFAQLTETLHRFTMSAEAQGA